MSLVTLPCSVSAVREVQQMCLWLRKRSSTSVRENQDGIYGGWRAFGLVVDEFGRFDRDD